MSDDGKIWANEVHLYYEKVGTGDHALLLLPGCLGFIKHDLEPLVQGIDRSKFTVVAFDPRGYGKSRPPKRDFPLNFLNRDADDGAALMEALGFGSYSVVGWSDGGNSACCLAAKYPSRVRKLVIWGANSYFSHDEQDLLKHLRDLSNWSDDAKKPFVEEYGETYFETTWHGWCDVFFEIAEERSEENGDTSLYKDELPKIKSETLVVHGTKDEFVPVYHPEYIHKHIQNSRLHLWKDGHHDLQHEFAKEFIALIEEFLSASPSTS